MPIAQLSIDMVAQLATYEKDLKRAVVLTEEQASMMTKSIGMVTTAIQGVGVALLIDKFATAVTSTATYVDEIGKMSQKVGMAVEDLSALSYAAKLSDVPIELLGKGMKKLSVLMQEAAAGSTEAKIMLKQLGTAETQDTNKALADIADRFAGLKDGAGKTALAARGLGEKIGPELIPLLNMGAEGLKAATEEARKFGLVVSKEAAEAAEKFNDNLERLAEMSKGAKVSLFGDLIKGLGNATEAYIKAATEGSKFQSIAAGIQVLFTGDDRHKNNVKIVEDTLALMKAQKALAAAEADGMNPKGIEDRKAYVALMESNLKTTKTYKELLDDLEAPPRKKLDPTPYNAETAKKARDLAEQGKELAQSLLGQSSGLSPDFYEKWNKLGAAYTGGAISLQRLLDAEAELLRHQPFEKKALEAAINTSEERQTLRIKESKDTEEFQRDTINNEDKFWRELLAATPSAKLEEQRRVALKITEGFMTGHYGEVGTKEAEAKYLEIIDTYLGRLPGEIDKTKSAAEELGMTFASAFEGAIVGGKEFSAVLDGLAQDVLRITVRKSITEPLAGWLSAGISSFLPKFAVGTDYVPQDMVALIHKGERIIPAAQNKSSSTALPVVVNQNFVVGDVASISMVRQAVAGAEQRIAAKIVRSITYGGGLS